MCEGPDLCRVDGSTGLLASLMGYEGGSDQSVSFVGDYDEAA